MSSPASRKNGKAVQLCFNCKDGYCFPILNQELIAKITKGSSLIKHLDLIQWNSQRSEEKTERCKTLDDYYNMIIQPKNNPDRSFLFKNIDVKHKKGYNNYLIVLPDGCKGRDIMIDTMQRTNTYIEYFHYDGGNQIDGFITHDLKNMVTVNNDYDLRKNICNQLFEKYLVDAFQFNNQGLTSIAVNLFKQLYRHIQKSNYNRYVTTIIDDYYPKALQHTFYTEDEDTCNITALDIAKDYPSVLLTNEHDIPMYNIHNTIHKFDGELKTEEYYIKETYIDKYNTINNEPIIIEAGFYWKKPNRLPTKTQVYHTI